MRRELKWTQCPCGRLISPFKTLCPWHEWMLAEYEAYMEEAHV